MQQIAQERYIQKWRGSNEKRLSIWYYDEESDMIMRDYGDGEGLKPEMSYTALKLMAAGCEDISSLRMDCTKQLVNFVRNKEGN